MNLYILGNGGLANELFDQLFLTKSKYVFQGFIILKDDKAFVINDTGISLFSYPTDATFVLATQNTTWRTNFIKHLSSYYDINKNHFPNIYSNNTHISSTAVIGIGNVFSSFSSVNGISAIGNFNLFNSYTSIYNKCKIGNYNILYPYSSVMRNCVLGDSNILNPNCIITEKITIGSENTITAGECVFDDLNSRELFQSGIVVKKI